MKADPGPAVPRAGLLIHVGMQKTGSTALQNFLLANRRALAGKGLHYIAHGRKNISHNRLYRPLRGEAAGQVWREIAAETAAHGGALSLLSSELLFDRGIAEAMARHMPGALRAQARVVVYARRQDTYLEAMYKQKTKNGRENLSPQAFVDKKGDELGDYAAVLDSFADALGADRILLRRFERGAMVDGDIVADFLSLLGLDKADDTFVQPAHEANQTLSRAVTEQLGALARHSGVNVRELAREMMRDPAGAPRRSGDVFTNDQRRRIMARFEPGNARIARRFLNGGDVPLFEMSDLAPGAPERHPDAAEEIRLYAEAQERVAAAIGRVEARGRAKLFRG
ncbi:hypothetical protein [Roseovarius salis]|uniref:hypothetical protein n=1 Tax=Roseovarius salis TaxID=3376063 RepID=UPI0037C82D2A